MAQTNQVAVPLKLDYPLLETLLLSQLFNTNSRQMDLLQDPNGCSEILLSEPQLSSQDSEMQMLAKLRARIGLGSPGACATLLRWEGGVRISGVPDIRSNGRSIGFSPTRVRLLNVAGDVVINDSLQSLADANVAKVFERFVVDLEPQLESFRGLLPEILPQHSREQISALLDGLQLRELEVTDTTVNAAITFSVEPIELPPTEAALTDEEIARWEERWQLMDSLLVLTVKHYAAATHLQSLRSALLDVLIESRYRLRDALESTPDTAEEFDIVRAWFLESWQALAPVIRRVGEEQAGEQHLLLVSVIAASDALAALDQLGPTIGLDISADGLRRLARMINGDTGDDLLRYSEELDPELKELYEESFGVESAPSAWHWDFKLIEQAYAKNADRLNSWAPKTRDLPEYLPLVAQLLQNSAAQVSRKRGLDKAYTELFRRLVLTTAWQESCWRHYVVSDDRKLVPLRSGTGDVGLMQINERVWRGFYNQQRLRWDIDYNGAAGAEVLIDYLLRYALRKGEHRQPGGTVNLARASYSAYNGGPSKVARYRSDKASTYGKKVDRLFWEKYQQVSAGNELAVSVCLGGNLSGPATKDS